MATRLCGQKESQFLNFDNDKMAWLNTSYFFVFKGGTRTNGLRKIFRIIKKKIHQRQSPKSWCAID